MPQSMDYRDFYKRNLPHYQPRRATFFITFCLSSSLPVVKERSQPTARAPQRNDFSEASTELEWFEEEARLREKVLDQARFGPLWLADQRIAGIVSESIHYRDGRVYRLDAFTIMPNHVHMLIKPLRCRKNSNRENTFPSLSSILHSLKRHTAREANRVLGRQGPFWQHESYDHCVRDERDWLQILNYILDNPIRVGLASQWREWPWTYLRQDN